MAEDAASKPFPNMYEDNFGGVTIEIHDDEPLTAPLAHHARQQRRTPRGQSVGLQR